MGGEFSFWWAAKLELQLVLSFFFLFTLLVWTAVVAIWLVSPPPPSPYPPRCLLSNQQWEWITSLLEALQVLPTLLRLKKAKVLQSFVQPSWCGPSFLSISTSYHFPYALGSRHEGLWCSSGLPTPFALAAPSAWNNFPRYPLGFHPFLWVFAQRPPLAATIII